MLDVRGRGRRDKESMLNKCISVEEGTKVLETCSD